MVTLQVIYFVLWSITIAATGLPLIRKKHWVYRIFEFPRVQKLSVALLGIILGAYLSSTYGFIWFFLIPQMLCALYGAYLIFPYTPFSHRTLPSAKKFDGQRIRFLIANVYQYNRESSKLRELIHRHNPDLCLFVETDERWREELQEAVGDYPFKKEIPLDNTYGMLCYSKLEFEDCEERYLVNDEFPSIRTKLKTNEGHPDIRFYGIHPPPPSPTEETYSTERDKEILLVGEEVEPDKEPVIVAGDLNDVAWSYTTQRFIRKSGLKDPRKGRGIFSTFHAKNWLMRWPLDHIFCSDHFSLVRLRRTSKIGSDHFPVLVDLQLEAVS